MALAPWMADVASLESKPIHFKNPTCNIDAENSFPITSFVFLHVADWQDVRTGLVMDVMDIPQNCRWSESL